MKNVIAKEKFNTSFGTAFVVDNPPELKAGEEVSINERIYRIRSITLPSRPTDTNSIVIFVE